MITLVAAMDQNRLIGKDGAMPWHLPAEMKHFRRVTRGQTVVMGRKTFQAIGGPLKGRTNIVVTRDQGFTAPGCEVVHSIDAVLRDQRPLYAIGGAELYRALLPHAAAMILTRIHHAFEGDTWFPEWAEADWRCVDQVFHPADEQNAFAFTVETYRRAHT